jgi:hypothetical protein
LSATSAAEDESSAARRLGEAASTSHTNGRKWTLVTSVNAANQLNIDRNGVTHAFSQGGGMVRKFQPGKSVSLGVAFIALSEAGAYLSAGRDQLRRNRR